MTNNNAHMNNAWGPSAGRAFTASLLLLIAGAAGAYAQTNEEYTGDAGAAVEPAPEPPAVGSAFSASLNFDVNSHFISYGADIWGTGGSWSTFLFNPSLNIGVDFGDGLYGFVGTWWDINDQAESTIGDDIQEIDLWVGMGYSYEEWNFELTYQEWIYGGDAERILDFAVSYDTFLNPTLLIHNRIDGNDGQKRGTVFVLGISQPFEYKKLAIDLGLDVGFNTTDFHGGAGGFNYVAFGPQVSYPLDFIPQSYGLWNFHAGLTFYYTPSSTVPNNPTTTFLTGNAGIGVDF